VTSNELDQNYFLFFLQYLLVTLLTFQNPIQISINQSITHSQTNKQNIKYQKCERILIEMKEKYRDFEMRSVWIGMSE
jgi:hypothetical protein